MTGKWGDPSGNPEDDWPDDEPELVTTTLRPWWSKAWVRGILFFVLLTPIIILVIVGPARWIIIVLAIIGLVPLLFNDLVYQSGSLFRALQYKDGEEIEQSGLSRATGMGCGGLLWLIAFGIALSMFLHG